MPREARHSPDSETGKLLRTAKAQATIEFLRKMEEWSDLPEFKRLAYAHADSIGFECGSPVVQGGLPPESIDFTSLYIRSSTGHEIRVSLGQLIQVFGKAALRALKEVQDGRTSGGDAEETE